MENFKFTLFLIVVLAILVSIGYWGFSTIESGSSHVNGQEIIKLTKLNKNLTSEISNLTKQINLLQAQIEEKNQTITEQQSTIKKETIQKTTTTSSKYRSLINDLQKLISSNILMKKGSTGTRVGTVQKFLNIYNKTSHRIDNDYGNATKSYVEHFQRNERITADGEAGPGTFRRMISWLNRQ